jgi:molybdate transport system ATP-binding protein
MIEVMIQKQLHTTDGFINLDIDIKAEDRNFIALFGKSGSGKTTLLRMIAGLTTPDKGKIVVNNQIWFSDTEKINIPPQKRKIGFVFQDYALFPNFTVLKNLLYVNKDKDKVEELLEIMDLKTLANRLPEKLSGGQKQRVALARAIARNPEILLLDEPLSALDGQMRLFLQDEIAKIYKLFPMTIFLVSHDLPEIFKLSQRVIMIDKGQIINDGNPNIIFSNAITSNKFSFIGEIIKIIPVDIIYVAYIAFGNSISEVVISENDYKNLKTGDKVLVASKAFNPIIKKIEF